MRQGPDDISARLAARLTGLPDLADVRERLQQWSDRTAFSGGDDFVAIHAMLISLRHVDALHRAYGAMAGDGALEEIVTRVTTFAEGEIEGDWMIARTAPGTFLVVADEACSRERWQNVAEGLAEAIARPIALPSGVFTLVPRIALVRSSEDEALYIMMERLDRALEAAPTASGVRISWAEGEVSPPGRSIAELSADLLLAIDRDEIEILFQPQYALPDDRLIGAEALVRWNHPRFGRMGAGALFAIAERADHVAQLSLHIARQAMQIACEWPTHLRLSINVTPADLAFGTYVRQMLDSVRQSSFAPGRLTLEVTEQALIGDINHAAQVLAELCAQGIRIALDDFGAGFCNFRYLKVLPLHHLKLDRSMIDGIVTDRRDLAVLRGILAMARALGLEVIAEGIESEDQRLLIAQERCAGYQGFLKARPMPAGAFLRLARKNT